MVCRWMWALRTKGEVHIFVTKEFTFDLNEASNSPTDDIAAQRVSARSVHGANDEEARTNEPLAVVIVPEEQLRESCWTSRLASHALPADDSDLPLVSHASDDTVAGFGHSDGRKSRGDACRAQLAEVSHRADVLCELWEREQSDLPTVPHASDDTLVGFGHSDGHTSRGGACGAQLAEECAWAGWERQRWQALGQLFHREGHGVGLL